MAVSDERQMHFNIYCLAIQSVRDLLKLLLRICGDTSLELVRLMWQDDLVVHFILEKCSDFS